MNPDGDNTTRHFYSGSAAVNTRLDLGAREPRAPAGQEGPGHPPRRPTPSPVTFKPTPEKPGGWGAGQVERRQRSLQGSEELPVSFPSLEWNSSGSAPRSPPSTLAKPGSTSGFTRALLALPPLPARLLSPRSPHRGSHTSLGMSHEPGCWGTGDKAPQIHVKSQAKNPGCASHSLRS